MAFCVLQKDITCQIKRQAHSAAMAIVQCRVRELKNKWWTDKAHEIQHLADIGDTRGFFSATKAIYGPSHRGSKDRKKILKTEEVKDHWREYFEDLLNQKTTVDEEVLNSIPQHPINEDMADPPSLSEVSDAISAMRNNKAIGPDGIPAEILKAGRANLHQHMYVLIKKIWDLEMISSDLRNALIVILFKKGDKADCGNYRELQSLSPVNHWGDHCPHPF